MECYLPSKVDCIGYLPSLAAHKMGQLDKPVFSFFLLPYLPLLPLCAPSLRSTRVKTLALTMYFPTPEDMIVDYTPKEVSPDLYTMLRGKVSFCKLHMTRAATRWSDQFNSSAFLLNSWTKPKNHFFQPFWLFVPRTSYNLGSSVWNTSWLEIATYPILASYNTNFRVSLNSEALRELGLPAHQSHTLYDYRTSV